MEFIVYECMTDGCSANLPGASGVYYCEACVAKQIERAKAEQEGFVALHGCKEPVLQAEIEGRI